MRQQTDGKDMVILLHNLYSTRIRADHNGRELLLAGVTDAQVRNGLFDSPPEIIKALLEELPDEMLGQYAQELIQRWFEVPEEASGKALERLARLAPQEAAELLLEVARRLDGPQEVTRMCGMAQAACKLGEAAGPAVDLMLERFECSAGSYQPYWDGLFAAAALLERDRVPAMVVGCLDNLDEHDMDGEFMLEAISLALAPDSPFLGNLFDIQFRGTGYYFSDVPELLRDDAPIAELDRLIELSGAADIDTVVQQMTGDGPYQPLTRFARGMAQALSSTSLAKTRRLVYLFCLAAVAARQTTSAYPVKRMDFRRLLEMLTIDLPVIPHVESLLTELHRLCDAAMLTIVHRELDEARIYRGSTRLIELIGRIGSPHSIGPLLNCLAEDCSENTVYAALEVLAGMPTGVCEYLAGKWSELDSIQQDWALEMVTYRSPEESARDQILSLCSS
jgi:hypothetical protein